MTRIDQALRRMARGHEIFSEAQSHLDRLFHDKHGISLTDVIDGDVEKEDKLNLLDGFIASGDELDAWAAEYLSKNAETVDHE